MSSALFEDPYDHINLMENDHEDTNCINTQEQNMEDAEVDQEEWFEYENENIISEE